MIQEITSFKEFQTLIAAYKASILYFSAKWCGPCKFVDPKFEELSEQYAKWVFAKIDIDEVPDVARAAQIRAVPTFCVYKGRRRLDELVAANPSKLEALCKRYLR